jgi:hypothetical protein
LDARYYRGFLESEIGEGDNATGRDKITASMKLAVRAQDLGFRVKGFRV